MLETMLLIFAAPPPADSSEHLVAVFIAEIALMLFVGRLLGELMQRIGQPAVMGQLIAGILLGLAAPFNIRGSGPNGEITEVDRQLPISQRFFAGGATTL